MSERLRQVLSCGRNRTTDATPRHRHPGPELLLIADGEADIAVGSEAYRSQPGDLIHVPAGCPHDQRNRHPTTLWYVVHDDSHASAAPMRLALSADEPLRRWIPDLVQLHFASGTTPAVEGALLATLLARIAQLVGSESKRLALPSSLAAALRRLEADPLEDLDEDGLAAVAGLSPRHLRSLFTKHLGVSPGEHRRNLRLTRAQKMLRSSYLPVAAVAAACGYEDANYFARLFRNRTGLTPRRWRAAHRV